MSFFHRPSTDISFTLSDTRPIINRLSTLPDKVQKGPVRKSARTAAQVIRKAAVRNAKAMDDKRSPERIWRNIQVQNAPKLGKVNGGVAMRVGVRGGARQYANTRENVRKGRVDNVRQVYKDTAENRALNRVGLEYNIAKGKTYKTGGDKSNPGGDTWYWRFVEFGTAKMGARPFLRRALSDNIQNVTSVAVGSLNVELDKLLSTPK